VGAPAAKEVRTVPDAAATPTIRLRMLSGFELSIDGEVVVLQPVAQRLLGFVALANRRVERSFVAFRLWPDNDEERAKANLRSALWRLRQASSELLASTKSHLWLCGQVWVDVRDGIREMHDASVEDLLGASQPFWTLDTDLLPDSYDDWLGTERERLRLVRLDELEGRAAGLLSERRFRDAIQLALAAVALDPLRESAHRLVIEAHLAEGNGVEARRQFDRYQDLLARDLALTASGALSDLLDARAPVAV
jgi:DNA-binding SARP family transcriptional activator